MKRNDCLQTNLVYTVVCVIGVLLLINAFLLYQNSRVIGRNRAIQAEAVGGQIRVESVVNGGYDMYRYFLRFGSLSNSYV